MEDKVLQKFVYKDSGSIEIMDEFESRDDKGEKRYDTLELRDFFCIKYRKKLYWVSLILQRKPRGRKCITSSLTFTDMRKGIAENVFRLEQKDSYEVIYEVFEGVKNIWNNNESEMLYLFPIPVKFNAQNSGNRSGCGNKYYGEELIYEGTLYGETSDYMFLGAKYRRWR